MSDIKTKTITMNPLHPPPHDEESNHSSSNKKNKKKTIISIFPTGDLIGNGHGCLLSFYPGYFGEFQHMLTYNPTKIPNYLAVPIILRELTVFARNGFLLRHLGWLLYSLVLGLVFTFIPNGRNYAKVGLPSLVPYPLSLIPTTPYYSLGRCTCCRCARSTRSCSCSCSSSHLLYGVLLLD